MRVPIICPIRIAILSRINLQYRSHALHETLIITLACLIVWFSCSLILVISHACPRLHYGAQLLLVAVVVLSIMSILIH